MTSLLPALLWIIAFALGGAVVVISFLAWLIWYFDRLETEREE